MNQMLPRPRFWADAAAQKQTKLSLFGELMVFVLVYLIASFLQSALISVPVSVWVLGEEREALVAALSAGASIQDVLTRMLDEMPDWLILASLASSAVLGAAALLYCRRFQKRDLPSLGLARQGAGGEYLLGLAVGLLLFGAVFAVGVGAGAWQLASASLDPARVGPALLALAACAVFGAAQELFARGYFAPSVGARAPVAFALILSALVPAMLQAQGALISMTGLNTLLLFLLLGIWTLKRGSLWGACALHGAWYFAENFFFQFGERDQHAGIRLLDVDADGFRPLLSGGVTGARGSICTTVVLLAAITAALALRPRNAAEPRPAPEKM